MQSKKVGTIKIADDIAVPPLTIIREVHTERWVTLTPQEAKSVRDWLNEKYPVTRRK